MKVCAVTTLPPHRDGVALYSAELYPQISKLANVQIVANISKQQKLAKSCKEKNAPVLSCWKRGLLYPFQVFRSTLKTRCHIIHLQHGWLLYGGTVSSLLFPVLLATFRLSNKPTVVTMHTIIRKDAHLYNNFFVNLLAKMAVLFTSRCILHFSHKVIVHNRLMKKILQTDYGAKAQKIVMIPHGVKQAPKKPESPQKSKETCILSLGFLRKGKGIDYLLEAFKKFAEKCPNTKLVIVGAIHAHDKNCSTTELYSLPASIQRQVLFTGFVDEQTLSRLIWKSDVIVLQSTEPYYVEASGTLAAVADYGKALVCSKVPKFQSELQHGQHCIFVNPSNSMELSQALVLLTNDNELRAHLGTNLKEKFENRNWNTVAKEHVTLYRHLI
ncbi:MAG: hypothetical protein CW691_02415 [Candidatus Bathyarchaeum sp.]|nr:MAG: hypothetical protein CW691_02415 [Candidatus Bathyarchaeum sp.]